jgi:hypothetical protein
MRHDVHVTEKTGTEDVVKRALPDAKIRQGMLFHALIGQGTGKHGAQARIFFNPVI